MKILNDKEIKIDGFSVVTLGNFDGIHRGHKKLIQKVNEICFYNKWTSVVFSFYPHPLSVIRENLGFQTILTQDEKISVMQQFNVDYLIQYPFTKEFAEVEADEFVKMIISMTNLKALVIGEDYSFGKGRKGNIELLKKYGEEYGFEVITIDKVNLNGSRVSSTKIRECINEKQFYEASALLDRNYFVTGKVSEGRKIGRTIGYPTANVITTEEKLLPPDGAYVTKTYYQGNLYYSLTNIGTNPTVNGNERTVETYIFDFDEEIYGEEIKVLFFEWIRDERAFENLEALKRQLNKDKDFADYFFKNN